MYIFIGRKEPEVEWISGGALRLDNVWHGDWISGGRVWGVGVACWGDRSKWGMNNGSRMCNGVLP